LYGYSYHQQPTADSPANVTACDSYTLPALTVGNYFTETGGTGTALFAADVITATQTIYVYAETGTTPNCTDENSFTVTINTSPTADAPANVTACDSYILPALTVGDYFTGTNGTGTALSATDVITSTQTIYVYAETGTTPNCTDENSFTVTINTSFTVDLGLDTILCSNHGDTILLDAGIAGMDYMWNDNSTEQTLMVNSTGMNVGSYTYYVDVTDGACESSDTIVIHIDVCSGIATAGHGSFSITMYPNPTNGMLNIAIEGLNSQANLSIMDISGRIILNEVLSTETTMKQVDFSHLPKGIYAVKVVAGDVVNVSRIVVQ
jgi:trimeric autotransporter adhesin